MVAGELFKGKLIVASGVAVTVSGADSFAAVDVAAMFTVQELEVNVDNVIVPLVGHVARVIAKFAGRADRVKFNGVLD